VRKLTKARFPVYLARSPNEEKSFALKVYPYEEDKISKFYLNEVHFADLHHPNIIKIQECQQFKNSISHGKQSKISYILMEYAPYGDFHDLVATKGVRFDDKLLRTYFHQLIQGLEYLHSLGIAHMDIKMDNLLLGEDFELKISDFDLSYYEGDDSVSGSGTPYYRAPEMLEGECYDPQAADIYSAGVILFVLKSGGKLPHSEHAPYEGINLWKLMYEDNPQFWKTHSKIQNKPMSFYDEDFKSLFNQMTNFQACDRPTIKTIKKTTWYNGPVYSKEDLKNVMKKKIFSQEN